MNVIFRYKLAFIAIGWLVMMTSIHAKTIESSNQTTQNLLFVGNSLTYTNQLPKLVQKVAAERGISITTKSISKPNYAIVDHWAEGQVQKLIKSKKYDYVILQQGPSSQQDGYDMLLNGGKLYSDLAKANGAKLAFYMVWPARRYFYTFDGVIANYTAAAEYNEAILCPVGKIWKAYFEETGDYSYYGPDNFHPSLKGSQVAAKIIVDSLFAEIPETEKFQQAWLTGLGQIENNQINVAELHITQKGAFGQDFEPEEIQNTVWGSMKITFNSCHQANMSYTSVASYNGVDFGTGGYPIQRLAINQAANNCEQQGFADNSDKSFFTGSYYGGLAKDGEGFNIEYLNKDRVIVTWYTYLPKTQ